MKQLALALPLIALCSACSDNPTVTGSDVTDLETAETVSEAEVLADSLETGDFGALKLGAKIVGPQGPEVKAKLSNAAGDFADITSYVACPEAMTTCDPATAPEGTIYTYVHIVYPGEDNDPDTGGSEANTSSHIELADGFYMTSPAHGFTGGVGYSKAEAMAAIGAKADVAVTCQDGKLVWTVSAGDGGDQWEQAEPLTFYWQSLLPPAGPRPVYEIAANYTTADGPGPYPAASKDIPNHCDLLDKAPAPSQ